MRRLRDKDGGCPWDVEQDFATIAPYTIEEAYEVADAIERQDMDGLRDELGDLLFQVVFHAQMAQEAGHFEFDDVVGGISDKMIVVIPMFSAVQRSVLQGRRKAAGSGSRSLSAVSRLMTVRWRVSRNPFRR